MSEDTHTVHGSHGAGFIKALGSIDALFVGFGAMIGFGWVVLTGGWIESAGTWGALLAFVVGGIIMALVGLVYSELVSAMPHAGGEHNYLMRGLGPRTAMLGSWAITGGYISVVMFEAVAVPRTVGYLFPGFDVVHLWTIADFEVKLTWALVGVAAAVLLTWINIRGIKTASLVQTFVVCFLLIVAAVLVVGAAVGGDVANTEPHFANGPAGFITVLAAVPFLFVGFDVIPQSAEEIKVAPAKIGRIVVWSVLMAVAFYLVIIYCTSLALPGDELSGLDLATADAVSVLFGNAIWGKIVIAGGLAGIITSWIAFLIGASRLLWAMARSGMIPAWFGKLHPKYRTPSNALLFIGVLSVVAPFLGVGILGWAVDAGSPMIVLTYFLVSLTFLVLRSKEPGMERPTRIGGRGAGGTAIGVFGLVLTGVLFLMYVPNPTPLSAPLAWQSYVAFAVWMLVGVVFMFRVPGGIKAGPDAEETLLARLRSRGRQG